MSLPFEGQTAVVTGASSGIGAALAVAFAGAGATVVVHYGSNRDAALRVVSSIVDSGGVAWAIGADLSRPEGAEVLANEVRQRSTSVDVLVNNAGGLLRRTPVEDADHEYYRRVFQLNIGSVHQLCRALLPFLRRSGGRIVNIGSVAAASGGGYGATLYAAAKGAVAAYTRALAKEVAPYGVRVNCISPGVIDTPLHERHSSGGHMAALVGAVPMARAGRPEDCAGAALFLADRDRSSYVTGQVLPVNGGMHFFG